MRVGLDARALTASLASGVEYYVVNLVRALSRLPSAPEIIAYVDRPIPDPELARLSAVEPLRTVVIDAPRGWLRLALPWRLWRDRVDLVHLPSTILPPLLPCPAVVTVHDLAWARHPETYQPDDLRMQTRVVPRSVRRAAHVLAVSETTATDVEQMMGVPRQRITAIPLAASPSFSAEGPRLSADAFPGADRLSSGYLLCVCRLQPRKNLMRLLEAYREARQEVSLPPLVLAGGATSHGEELAQKARELGLAGEVVFPGYVPDGLLPLLYRSATVFVYPSLYEGFGLPVLEAMASGVPVITSTTSALAEVAGDAALLADPLSVEQLAGALGRLLTDSDLRKRLSAGGLARSREFTWQRTAEETVAVYRHVAGRE
jgi:glycosyltransferase involved in cell wall biosynthesis